ncbi:MAG: TatD family hydrolase [Victivallaceae bacterium]|nr:TatD family hydrolase [Victivallaceae bacterium]
MASDFHTHRVSAARGLLSTDTPGQAEFSSLEYHPWNVPADFSSLPGWFVERVPAAAAVGECGLDRCRGPELEVQMAALEAVRDAARRFGLPLVVHCVRCDGELFSILDPAVDTVVIHGFRHSVTRLENLLGRGCYVSLAPDALRNTGLLEFLGKNPFDRIGFETDDTGLDIAMVVRKAASMLHRSDVETATDGLFDRLFGRSS